MFWTAADGHRKHRAINLYKFNTMDDVIVSFLYTACKGRMKLRLSPVDIDVKHKNLRIKATLNT